MNFILYRVNFNYSMHYLLVNHRLMLYQSNVLIYHSLEYTLTSFPTNFWVLLKLLIKYFGHLFALCQNEA